MPMNITIDTKYPLTEQDVLVLRALLGEAATGRPTGVTEAQSAAESPLDGSEAAGDTSLALDEALLEEALSRGKDLLKAKKGSVLRAALDQIGAKKVTEITTNDDLRAFLVALPAE